MTTPIRILMQTTIPFAEDDWHIGRFSLLRDELSSMKDQAGNPLCEVTARNREADARAGQSLHARDRPRSENLLVRDERPVDVGQQKLDRDHGLIYTDLRRNLRGRRSTDERSNILKAPNSKLQAPEKHQATITKTLWRAVVAPLCRRA